MMAQRSFKATAAALLGAALLAPGAAAQPAAGNEDRVEVLSYVIVDGASAPEPLTDKPGDAARGKAIFFDPKLGGCVACHWTPGVEAPKDSLPGPSLDKVGARLASGVIRLWIVNPRALKADTTMPAYFSLTPKTERLPDDAPERLEPVLTAQEVEDLIVYLKSVAAAGSTGQ